MNIGFVVHHYDPADGTGGYAAQLVPRIATQHEVTLYAAALRAPVPANVRVVRVPAVAGSAYLKILTFPAAFAAVRRRHELVHAQGWVATSAELVTAHIVLAAWREAAARARIPVPPGERWLGGFVARREAGLLARARHVIAPSERARADIRRCAGRADGVSVIHHGFPAFAVPLDRKTARRRFRLPDDGFVALYAGDARKGFADAVTALAAVPGARLLVASRSQRAPYEALAKARGVASRLCWTGALDDMGPAYAAADVLLYPTIYDTFSMVVAEAMAFGVPVIVSREAGITDLIEHRQSGWILDSRGPEAAAALRALQDDPALRTRLADGGRAVAARRMWDHVAAETMETYRRTVETGR